MRIKVLLFAKLREDLGQSEVLLEVPEPTTAAQVFDQLLGKYNYRCEIHTSIGFAINQHHVSPDASLKDQDELAILPPMSGG